MTFNKGMAIAVFVAMMFCVAPVLVVDGGIDAAGTPVATSASGLGDFNIYFQISEDLEVEEDSVPAGSIGSWAGYKGDGTDGYLALMDVLNDISMTSGLTIDSAFSVSTPYITNNLSYGKITELFGLQNDDENTWSIFVYKDSSWAPGVDGIGLYQPFSDYADDYEVSNIALYYGSDSSSLSFSGLSILPLTTVPNDSSDPKANEYRVSFEFEYTDANGSRIERTAIGYGSNGFTALQNAIGTNNLTGVVGSSDFDTYGWITTLFGLGTVQTAGQDTPNIWTDDKYTYWNMYYDSAVSGDPVWTYANFTSAFYGSIDGSAMHADSFRFVYE